MSRVQCCQGSHPHWQPTHQPDLACTIDCRWRNFSFAAIGALSALYKRVPADWVDTT